MIQHKHTQRLCKLFGFDHTNEKHLKIFNNITSHGAIAGGAMVYALNEFVPRESVGDIDIFVLDGNSGIRSFWIIIEELTKFYSNYVSDFLNNNLIKDVENIVSGYVDGQVKYTMYSKDNNKKTHDGIDHEDTHSIININFLDIFNIQVIMSACNNIIDVLDNFDLDFVQCAYYNGKAIISNKSKSAHERREVTILKTPIRSDRIKKIYSKGFQLSKKGVANVLAKSRYIKMDEVQNPTQDTVEITPMSIEKHIIKYTRDEDIGKIQSLKNNEIKKYKLRKISEFQPTDFYRCAHRVHYFNTNVNKLIEQSNSSRRMYMCIHILPKERHSQATSDTYGELQRGFHYLDCEVKGDLFEKIVTSNNNKHQIQKTNELISFKYKMENSYYNSSMLGGDGNVEDLWRDQFDAYNNIELDKWHCVMIKLQLWDKNYNDNNCDDKQLVLCPEIYEIIPLDKEPSYTTFDVDDDIEINI